VNIYFFLTAQLKNFIDCKFKLIFIKFMPLKKETDD